jgi:hypothetical protein
MWSRLWSTHAADMTYRGETKLHMRPKIMLAGEFAQVQDENWDVVRLQGEAIPSFLRRMTALTRAAF